ncbi:hypothetical protein [Vagococcus fluvialis]|uniref:hypothetical protein n=1 Tax=Vagococcus fluvialis TaxID=2738 RepID=UPI001D0A7138|nr:hypothetical protein [Vagococcus fluvialis]UDM70616.1 hypothetical protein K5L00_10840 [Vagococcus fluvialis]UDM78036.1 hypothetical protein K5K98_06380 [Vagococcus fluvialis]UDM82305.1 hypothetical protein K5K96_13320 [Vagococcus fluvialis]
MFLEERKYRFFSYIEIFLFIIIGFSPLFSQYLNVFFVITLIFINIKFNKEINTNKILTLFIIIILFVINLSRDFVYYHTFSLLDFYFILTFFLGLLISEKYTQREFFILLERIIFILAIFSLVGVFLYTFLPNLVNKFPRYNYYHTTHITSYFHNFLISQGEILKRNAGIAWEPGAFQFILNLGFYSYLKYNSKYNYTHLLIYLISIVSTLSSTGLIILASIIFLFFGKNKKLRYLVIVALILLFPLIQQIIEKQAAFKFNEANMFIRFNPLITAFQVGKSHLIGIGNVSFEKNYINEYQYPWDSYGQIFLRYGYPLFTMILIFFSRILKKDLSLFAIVFFTFLTENIWFFPIITIIYFYSFENFNDEGIKNENTMVN